MWSSSQSSAVFSSDRWIGHFATLASKEFGKCSVHASNLVANCEFLLLDIRKVDADTNTVDLDGKIKGYKFHNVTKYYENDIVFISHEDKHINLVPIELLEDVEGCIVYFESENVRDRCAEPDGHLSLSLPLF